jgi:hypothetical protein
MYYYLLLRLCHLGKRDQVAFKYFTQFTFFHFSFKKYSTKNQFLCLILNKTG